MRLRLLFLFSLFLFLSLISVAHAEGEIDITEVPQKLATQLGCSLFVGQLISATILLMIGLMPTLLLTRNSTAHMIVGMLMMSIGIGLGWLPVWTLIVICFLIAVLFASKFKGLLS